ncbi:MAG: type III pantothenate kinase [bacterium]
MLLVMDIGNTNTVLGVYEGERLLNDWRITTQPHQTADEYGIILKELFGLAGMSFDNITDLILSCVVPPLEMVVAEMARKYFDLESLIVGPGTKTGMPVLYENPRDVGADRIVNGVAAIEKYGAPCIVIDFGTATTFDAISADGEYLGGIITPGILLSYEALFHKAAKLPLVDMAKPKSVIGRTTVASMQSGMLYGYVGLVEGIVARMKEELGGEPKVIGTGGLVETIARETDVIVTVDHSLALEGLRLIYERNLPK